MINPTQYYPEAMYNSMAHKPFEYYFRNSNQVYSIGNQLFFGMKALKTDTMTAILHLEEFLHAYFYEHKLILDDYVDQRILNLFARAKKQFTNDKAELSQKFSRSNFQTIVDDIVAKKGLQVVDAEFLATNIGDFIFSVSDLKAGYGHGEDYMKKDNNAVKEWSVRQFMLASERQLKFNTYFLFQEHLSMFEFINEDLLNIIKSTNEQQRKQRR